MSDAPANVDRTVAGTRRVVRGIASIAAGVGLFWLAWAHADDRGPRAMYATTVAFLFVAGLCLAVGGACSCVRSRERKGAVRWVPIALVVGSVLGLELGARALTWWRTSRSGNARSGIAALRAEAWVTELAREEAELEHEDIAIFGWRPEPRSGRWLNVDGQGCRKTWNSSAGASAEAREVRMFGGSAVWGRGVRDEGTLPSCLARELAHDARAWRVVNAGRNGFTFVQGVFELASLLLDGFRPAWVVFYDGANDVHYAGLRGAAGTSMIDAFPPPPRVSEISAVQLCCAGFERALAQNSALLRLAGRIVQRGRTVDDLAYDPYPDLRATLAAEITERYFAAMELLTVLAERYGFGFICFWQPHLFTEERITDEERTLANVKSSTPPYTCSSLERLFQDTAVVVRTRESERFHYLGDCLRGRQETYYSDPVHVTEEANAVIAREIARHLLAAADRALRPLPSVR